MRSLLLTCLALVLPQAAQAEAPPPSRPNIVLIITDDQGYGDLRCHGNPIIETPQLDRLHAQSVRLTDFHVSPTCAPTRSSLMTGRHEFKSGVTHTIHERERLSLKATTLAQVLKGGGYTTGIFGKWHLGDEDAYQPGRRGFDEVFIHGAGGIGQSYPGSCGDAPKNTYDNPVIRHNGTFVKTEGYCTDVFFRQATRWIDSVRGQSPFFCYLTTNAPHGPLICPPEYEARYSGRVPPNVAKFYGMITNIDDNVGRLLDQLKTWNLERETLVIFMTDNGTATGAEVFNAGMRGAKGTPHNGGTRVPSFWRWPGVLEPGDRPQLTAHVDYFRTLAEFAGIPLSPEVEKQVEGRNLVPLLKSADAPWPDRYLFTHVGRWERGKASESQFRNASVRHGPHLLVFDASGNPARGALFDLMKDPGQKVDLAAEQPQVVARLRGALDEWWQDVLPRLENEDAIGPSMNPYHAAYWKQFGGGPQQ